MQAVLAIWTERRRPVEVCRELAITPKVLSQWEQRALSGMLKALESRPAGRRPGAEPEAGAAAGPAGGAPAGRLARLDKRLAKLQEPKAVPSPPK